MKRISVTVDEKLLKQTREATGEKTNSAAIMKVLEDAARRRRFWEKYDAWEKEVKKGDYFWPDYLEEIRPNAVGPETAGAKRLSAHEARAPQKKTSRRGRTR